MLYGASNPPLINARQYQQLKTNETRNQHFIYMALLIIIALSTTSVSGLVSRMLSIPDDFTENAGQVPYRWVNDNNGQTHFNYSVLSRCK